MSALVAGRAPLIVRPEAEVAAVAGFDVHRGVLASADRLPLPPASALVDGADLVLVAEGIGDHENAGALFRNAAAFGVDAVLLDPTTADPLYRRSVRVSLGTSCACRGPASTPWPDALRALVGPGVHRAGPHPGGRRRADRRGRRGARTARPADRGVAADSGPTRLALVVGAEGPGLTAAAMDAATRRVRIPTAPGVDSLNVATAAAVALHALTGSRFS